MRESVDNFVIDHPFFLEAKRQLQLCYDSFDSTPDPRCTPILGASGCGKSTMIKEFVRTLEPPEDPRTKLVIVIETPSNPTVKSMASEVLQAIGDPMFFRGTEVQMTDRIVKLLKKLGTRLLIFDELQNLIDKESDKLSFKAADWLKRLINISKIPTVIVGLERAEELFLVNEQLRRRFTESYVIEVFDWKNMNTRKMLKGFLKALQQKYRFEENLQIYNNEMAFRFYCASGGLVGYLMAIVREAERLAIGTLSNAIGLEHLAQAYRNAVCGNRLVGVNPFASKDLELLEAALSVVKGAKPIKRKDKRKQNCEKDK